MICTHMHPDHIGAAHWLCERFGVRLWISATDYNVARLASSASAGFGGPLSAAFMAEHGMAADPKAVDGVGARSNYYRSLVPALPQSYRRLIDGGSVEIGRGLRRHAWTCHAGYGHAPEHMALHDAAGGTHHRRHGAAAHLDHVSVVDANRGSSRSSSPRRDRGMRLIPSTRGPASHCRPFAACHTRIDQLQSHHAARSPTSSRPAPTRL